MAGNKLVTTEGDNALSYTLDSEQITPDYFLAHYADFLRRVIAKGNPSNDTMKQYCLEINAFIQWCKEHNRHPLSMHEYQIIIYREYLLNRQYKSDTIKIKLAAIRAFYAAAKKIGLLKINPAADVDGPTVGYDAAAMLNFYTPDQMLEIVHVFDEEPIPFIRYRDTLILYLMGVEGLRNVEVHRACCEDINWDVGAIMVRGKGAKGRMEPIYPCKETFEIIEKYLDAIPADHPVKKDGVLTPLILSASNKNEYGRISRNGIRIIMNKALTACNLKHPGFSCHVFRHSCGTNLYQATKDLRLVQNVLRHRDPKVTARYAHVNQKLSHRATSAIVPHDDTKDEPLSGTGKVAAILIPKGDGSKEKRPIEIRFEEPPEKR